MAEQDAELAMTAYAVGSDPMVQGLTPPLTGSDPAVDCSTAERQNRSTAARIYRILLDKFLKFGYTFIPVIRG